MAIRPAQRRYKNRGPRRSTTYAPGGENRVARRTPITLTRPAAVGNTIVFTADQPIVISGIPAYQDGSHAGALPTGISNITSTSFKLTWAAAPGTITVPFEDPHVRNKAGGYVLSGDYAPPG